MKMKTPKKTGTVTITVSDVEIKPPPYEIAMGCVVVEINGRIVFYGAAEVWFRVGSNHRKIVAFFDWRPTVWSTNMQAICAPETVRIRGGRD